MRSTMRLWLLLCACVYTHAYNEEFYPKFTCVAPRCIQNDKFSSFGNFTVDGHTITFGYDQGNVAFDQFILDCNGWSALEASAMPSFEKLFKPAVIELRNCPMPSERTLISALRSFNMQPTPKNGEAYLVLKNQPQEPQLNSFHLRELDFVTSLSIFSPHSEKQLEPASQFLTGLTSLRSLFLSSVKLPRGELGNLPPSLAWLRRTDQHLNTLHKSISSTATSVPSLRYLKLEQTSHSEDYEFHQLLDELHNDRKYLKSLDNVTSSHRSEEPSLERVKLPMTWTETKLEPLENCGQLRSITFSKLVTEELPDRWMTNCPKLEQLIIYETEQITKLPSRLLEGAGSLKQFAISVENVTSLPEGLLKDAHNLESFYIKSPKLNTISSSIFQSAKGTLKEITVSGTKLDNSALAAFHGLQALEELWLEDTELTGDLCYGKEFAGLRSLLKLKVLKLPRTVSVCKYWRSRFHALTYIAPHASWSG